MHWLQNSWMDNPTFLAEMAHFAWAYGILLTAALFSVGRRGLLKMFAAFVAFAVLKEFWYDLTYEIPNDTLAGSTLDFAVYLAGGGVALGVIWLKRHLEWMSNEASTWNVSAIAPDAKRTVADKPE